MNDSTQAHAESARQRAQADAAAFAQQINDSLGWKSIGGLVDPTEQEVRAQKAAEKQQRQAEAKRAEVDEQFDQLEKANAAIASEIKQVTQRIEELDRRRS
jgi:hypothetical protein